MTHPSEKSIFVAALEKASPAERAAYLDEACGGDPRLRAEVEALRAAHDRLGELAPDHGARAPGATADESAVAEGPGTRIGPYKLLEQIGEGGMGVVWMAEQQEQVRRMVALKIIKAGMDSAQVVARFEAERQALALMDHPNIAKVLDAGTTGVSEPRPTGSGDACPLPVGRGSGRPYFVMELVKGVPITKYCDEHRLTLRQRLELFVPVCQAVQHAHQKGIIDRDLKPSNVLVAAYDGKPVPKVIDFGVAKATGQKLTERTLFTGFGNLVGTLEYMSPEQAEFNALDIDTRSDIYTLGVLLYELLTGTTPLTKQRLKEAGLAEVLRVIREEEPPKPSTRLSASKERLAPISAQCQMEPAKLTKLVRGELDWIVMKALEKDRTRRYETANGFAQDIERYLADELVEACPPSVGYRLRKVARKYQKALTIAVAFGFLLFAGIVVSTWQAVRARAARAEAEAQSERATEAVREATAKQHEAETVRQQLRYALYTSNMQLIQSIWDSHKTDLVQDLLNELRPRTEDGDLRSFEWHYLRRLSRTERRLEPVVVHGPETGLLPVRAEDLEKAYRGAKIVATTAVTAGSRFAAAWDRPDGKTEIKVWDATGKVLFSATDDRAGLEERSLRFSRDGNRLAYTATNDYFDFMTGKPNPRCRCRVWDVGSGKELFLRDIDGGYFIPFAFSPDGGRLATSHVSGWDRAKILTSRVSVWDLAASKEVLVLDPGYAWLAFSPDGRRIAGILPSPLLKAELRVWDAATGEVVLSQCTFAGAFRRLAFSDDGRRLAVAVANVMSSDSDEQVYVLEATSGKVLSPPIRGFRGTVQQLAFSPDGRRLVSSSRYWDPPGVPGDQPVSEISEVKFWDLTSSREVLTLRTKKQGSFAFSPGL
jgi:serine/threonine protein kinase